MTSSILNRVGVRCEFVGNKILIQSTKSINKSIQKVESDWSSSFILFYFVSLIKDQN